MPESQETTKPKLPIRRIILLVFLVLGGLGIYAYTYFNSLITQTIANMDWQAVCEERIPAKTVEELNVNVTVYCECVVSDVWAECIENGVSMTEFLSCLADLREDESEKLLENCVQRKLSQQ